MKKFTVFAGIAGLFALGIVLARVVMAQTGGANQVVNVNISDTALLLTPSSARLGVNTPFSLTVRNSGTFIQSLVLEKQGAVNQPITLNGSAVRIDNIAPGSDIAQLWMINTAGNYQLAAYTSTNATTASALTATLVVASAAPETGDSLPQTGGPDDRLPLGLVLIVCGTLFVVGSWLVGRKLARRSH